LDVKAAIHCVDELREFWFSVGMEVSQRDQTLAINTGRNGIFSEGIWLSGKTLGCRLRDCEFDPLTLTKITKRRCVRVLSRKNAPVYQCFTLGTLKNLVCHMWWVLQYLALWATNNN